MIAMALYRNEPIENVVERLALALPDKHGTLLAESAIAQARKRLKDEALEYLFAVTAAQWCARSADQHRWRGARRSAPRSGRWLSSRGGMLLAGSAREALTQSAPEPSRRT